MQSPSDERVNARSWWLIAALILALSCWRILHLGRGTTFFFDEWNFLLTRSEISIANTLNGHNGHLSAIPASIYQVLVRIFGAGTYLPYRTLVAVLHCAIALVVGLLVRRSAGGTMSLASVAVVGFMGAGWQNWLWGFQIGMELSVLFGLLAVLIAGRDSTTANQNLVGLCVTVSVLSSGVGIPVLLGLGVAAVVRRKRVELTWLISLVGLYGVWSINYGQSQARSSNIGRVPTYVAESAAAAFGGIGGWSVAIGAVFAGVVLSFVAQNFLDSKKRSRDVAVLSTICAAGWVLSGLSRAHLGEPGASRYVHVGISWIVPIIGILFGTQRARSRVRSGIVILVSAIAVWGAWDLATYAGREFRERSLVVRAEISAMGQIDSPVRFDYQPDPARAPQIKYGAFSAFGLKYSTPGLDPKTFGRLPEFVRQEIDRVFLTGPGVKLEPADQPMGWRCRTVSANYEEIARPGSARWFQGVHSLEIKRFAVSSMSMVPQDPGSPSKLELGSDRNRRGWKLKYVSAAPFVLCASG